MDEPVLADVTPLLIGPKPNIVGAGVVEPNTDVGDGGQVDSEDGGQVDIENGGHADMLYDVTFLLDDDDKVRDARENIMRWYSNED